VQLIIRKCVHFLNDGIERFENQQTVLSSYSGMKQTEIRPYQSGERSPPAALGGYISRQNTPVRRSLPTELATQPSLGKPQIMPHHMHGLTQHGGGLLGRHSTEVPHLDE
jgi:hypothetical protein